MLHRAVLTLPRVPHFCPQLVAGEREKLLLLSRTVTTLQGLWTANFLVRCFVRGLVKRT